MRPLYLKQLAENPGTGLIFKKDISTSFHVHTDDKYGQIPWTTYFTNSTLDAPPIPTIRPISDNNIARDSMTFHTEPTRLVMNAVAHPEKIGLRQQDNTSATVHVDTPVTVEDMADILSEEYTGTPGLPVRELSPEISGTSTVAWFEQAFAPNGPFDQPRPTAGPIIFLKTPYLFTVDQKVFTPVTHWTFLEHFVTEPSADPGPEIFETAADAAMVPEAEILADDHPRFKPTLIRKNIPFGILHITGKRDVPNANVIIEHAEEKARTKKASDYQWFQPLTKTYVDLAVQEYPSAQEHIALVNPGVPLVKNEKSMGPVEISWEGSEQGPAYSVEETTNDGDQNNSQTGH